MSSESHPTLSDLLSKGKAHLEAAGIEDSSISAELLLRSILGLSRSEFILAHGREFDPKTEKEYKALIERRAAHEPLQHLVGWVDFFNVTLKTDSRALIPRPETEILVKTVLDKLNDISCPEILDIGTGAGNIAVTLAKNLPESRVTALDISAEALRLAAFNANHNGVENRVRLQQGDILDSKFAAAMGIFDCVVSNPPYVSYAEKGSLQPEITEFEPAVAVFSGDDPLIFYKTIIGVIPYILHLGGLLAFEVGLGQARLVAKMMAGGIDRIEIARDLAGIERIVTGIYARPVEG